MTVLEAESTLPKRMASAIRSRSGGSGSSLTALDVTGDATGDGMGGGVGSLGVEGTTIAGTLVGVGGGVGGTDGATDGIPCGTDVAFETAAEGVGATSVRDGASDGPNEHAAKTSGAVMIIAIVPTAENSLRMESE